MPIAGQIQVSPASGKIIMPTSGKVPIHQGGATPCCNQSPGQCGCSGATPSTAIVTINMQICNTCQYGNLSGQPCGGDKFYYETLNGAYSCPVVSNCSWASQTPVVVESENFWFDQLHQCPGGCGFSRGRSFYDSAICRVDSILFSGNWVVTVRLDMLLHDDVFVGSRTLPVQSCFNSVNNIPNQNGIVFDCVGTDGSITPAAGGTASITWIA